MMSRILILCVFLATTGCNSDPLKRDLEAYQKQVLSQTSEDFETPSEDPATARPPSLAQLAEECETRVAPRYRDLWQRTVKIVPQTPEVVAFNLELREASRKLCHLAKEYAGALRRSDREAQDSLDVAIASVDLPGVLRRFERLCELNHVKVK
jgi:hypothetical protein